MTKYEDRAGFNHEVLRRELEEGIMARSPGIEKKYGIFIDCLTDQAAFDQPDY